MIRINFIKSAIIFFMMALLLSCSKEGSSSAEGYLKLDISKDESLIVVQTKAEEGPIYKVSVVDSKGATVASYDNHNDMAATPLKLKAGKYTVIATTGKNGGYAAFDMPVYQGQDEVEVIAGQTSTAQIVCTLSQVKVSVKCDKAVTDAFKTVIVTVTNHTDFTDGSRNLIYNSDDGVAQDGKIGKDGYFQCTGTLSYKIYLVNNNDEISDGDLFGTISNINPKEHYTLNLSLSENDEGGAIVPGINVDGTTNKKEYDIVVNLNKKTKPTFSTNGFNLNNTAYISIGSALTWQVNLISKAGIEKLSLSHNSAELADKGIPAYINMLSMESGVQSAINSAGLVWSGVVAGSKESMTFDFSTLISSLPLGDYEFIFNALDKQAQEVTKSFKFKVIPSVETSTISADPWGRHAFLYGMYNTVERPAGMGFEYKKASDSDWIKVTDGLTVDGVNYSLKVTDLDPRTKYLFRTVSDKEPSNEMEFTTLGADQIANMNFDTWTSGSPNISGNILWSTSNDAAGGIVSPVSQSTDVLATSSSVSAVKLETKAALGVLAAGSVYLGSFVDLVGVSGAKLNFGRPYDCKPLSMKGYYNYAPVTVSHAKAPYTSMKGNESDVCQIYVILADWPSGYFAVNNASDPKVLIDAENDPYIIGYGAVENNKNTNGYVPFEIPIEYRSNRIPTTCVIVCSSSKYGDYFTGGVGSTLYVDEFEFVF